MTIVSGTKLGPYEVLEPIGAGGMGEVYKATDTRLERTVAIKVLPSHVSNNPQVRERFDREARTISQLNHPHICTLHDVGRENGIDFLVMEHIEGGTLAERLAKGALPLEQALQHGIEIADALDKAHRQGVVHRDLKPGNIMLTKSGAKLLDFGLAKMSAPGSGPDLSSLPTEQKSLTQPGAILGTFQYMAPEQLEGKEADARTDIFAFGAVAYEMVTGRRAFEGKSQASLIGAILKDNPPALSTIQSMSPPLLDHVIRRCLAKEPDDRWQSASDVMQELKWIGEAPESPTEAGGASHSSALRRTLPWAAALAVLLVGAGLGRWTMGPSRGPERVVRSAMLPPDGTDFHLHHASPGPAVLSPDGRKMTFSAIDAESTVRLYVRPLDGDARPLEGTEGAQYPFWSPDSRSVAFFANGQLKRIDVAGGGPFTVCEARDGKGGSWGPGGHIVFTPISRAPIHHVSVTGGESVPITELNVEQGENSHRHPRFLPDGRHFLYLARVPSNNFEDSKVMVGSLDGGESKQLLHSPAAAEYASEHLLFMQGNTLIAQQFDPAQLSLKGEAIPIAENVRLISGNAYAAYSADEKTLLYQTGKDNVEGKLEWFTRDGKSLGSLGDSAVYGDVSVSPDGAHAAVVIGDPNSGHWDLWIYEIARDLRTRVTFHPRDEFRPVWHPDGTSLAFNSTRRGPANLYRKNVFESSEAELLFESDERKIPRSWSPDGELLAFDRRNEETGWDLWILPVTGDREPYSFIQTRFNEWQGVFSPDGKWIAYVSNKSGQDEIYVAPFPGRGRDWQISTDGGISPSWPQEGDEIVYLGPDATLRAVAIRGQGNALEVEKPTTLLQTRGRSPLVSPAGPVPVFSPTPDATKFLVITQGESPPVGPLKLVTNWMAELDQ